MKSVGAFYESDVARTHGEADLNDENHYRLYNDVNRKIAVSLQ